MSEREYEFPEWLCWMQVVGAICSLLLLAFMFGQGCAPKPCADSDLQTKPAGSYACVDGEWQLEGASR